MKPNDVFSIRDFFTYYLAGIFWILDALVLIMLLSKLGSKAIEFSSINSFLNDINFVVSTIGLIIIPYVLGFILNPLGNDVMASIRKNDNEAVKWVTDPTHRLASQGLKDWEQEKILGKIKTLYKTQNKPFEDLFWTIRAYVEEHGKGANLLANRSLDLANFAESLVVPLPVFFILMTIWYTIAKSLWAFLFLGIGIASFYFLRRRYLDLRSYWVKHVYRAFIAINND